MNGGFEITVASLSEYEELVAEIYIDEVFVGLLSQEAGPDATVFEIASGSSMIKVELATFEEALAHAKKRLRELRKQA